MAGSSPGKSFTRSAGPSSVPRCASAAHTTPVGVTYDPDTRIARVITDRGNKKVRTIRAALTAGTEARVAVSQAEGRRWSTLEGTAVIKDDPSPSPTPSAGTPSGTRPRA